MHFCRRHAHPMRGRVVQHGVAAGQVIDAGGLRVLQGHHRLAVFLQNTGNVAGQFRPHQAAMERDLLFRIEHHRAADEHGRSVMLDGVNNGPALRPVSPRGETDRIRQRAPLWIAPFTRGVTSPFGESNVPSRSMAIIRYGIGSVRLPGGLEGGICLTPWFSGSTRPCVMRGIDSEVGGRTP